MARSQAVVTALGERVATDSLAEKRALYTDEVVALIEAAHRAYRRNKYTDTTVAEILQESGLGTRAFYRHFQSKDELLLAMLEYEAELFDAHLRTALRKTTDTLAKLECWIDRQLALVFEPSRAARTALFERERHRLAHVFPDRTAEILQKVREPLTAILEEGAADGTFPRAVPESDAPIINAIVVSYLESWLGGKRGVDRDAVRTNILRFCLPALGVRS